MSRIFLISDPNATQNRTYRNTEIAHYFSKAGHDIRIYSLKRIQDFFYIKSQCGQDTKVIAQVSPRRNIILSILIGKRMCLIELRDPICDWHTRDKLLAKCLDAILCLAVRLTNIKCVARRNLGISSFERAILGKNLITNPEFGVASFVNVIDGTFSAPFMFYGGNIYNEDYRNILVGLAELYTMKNPVVWAGKNVRLQHNFENGNILKLGEISKQEVLKRNASALFNILINTGGKNFIPSKFSELLSCGRPIMYIVKEPDRLTKLIENWNIGKVFIYKDSRLYETTNMAEPDMENVVRIANICRKLFSDRYYHQALYEEVRNIS